jgi:hypothetical protein
MEDAMKTKIVMLLAAVILVVAGVAGGLFLSSTGFAQPGDSPSSGVPGVIGYQGTLCDPDTGLPLPDGDYEFRFTISACSDPFLCVPLWTEYQTVTVESGVFDVLLGSVNPIDPSLFSGTSRYLGVKVGSDPEMPRQLLASVPYAFRAESALSADAADAVATHTVTKYHSVPACAFTPWWPYEAYWTRYDMLANTSLTPSTTWWFAPVNLPDGATLTEMEAWFFDDCADKDIDVALYEYAYSEVDLMNAGTEIAKVSSSGSLSAWQSLTTEIGDIPVNNSSAFYYVSVTLQSTIADQGFSSVRLEYEVVEPVMP